MLLTSSKSKTAAPVGLRVNTSFMALYSFGMESDRSRCVTLLPKMGTLVGLPISEIYKN